MWMEMQPKAREKEGGSRRRGRETAGDQLIVIVKGLFHRCQHLLTILYRKVAPDANELVSYTTSPIGRKKRIEEDDDIDIISDSQCRYRRDCRVVGRSCKGVTTKS